MEMQDDDMKFYSLMVEKGQKEITACLREVIAQLSKDKKDDSILQALMKHSASIEGFGNAIKNLPKPEVKLESNHAEVVKSLNEMGDNILNALIDLKSSLEKEPEKKEFVFTITRNQGGYINQITAKQK